MSKQKYTDEQVEDNKKKLLEELDRSVEDENEYIDNFVDKPERLELDRMQLDERTDDDIYNAVKLKLDEKYGAMNKQAKDNAESAKQSFSDKIKKAYEQAEEDKSKIEKDHENAKKTVENDAVKRGIARSTIANGAVSALERAKIDKQAAVEDEKVKKTEDLEKSIEKAQSALEALLAEYESKRNSEQEAGVVAEKKARDEANNKAMEYNNEAEKAEFKSRDKAAEAAYQKQVDDVKKEYERKRFDTVIAYYNTFDDKNEAIEDFLSDLTLKKYLGRFYQKAFNYLRAM